ncbi:hypothetical protein CspeluHIS016_0503950 [Cutaneotrichosporon spelunceum]|uniref:BZIP domain-containing protein n=1 Tax=Cutaneotrichosporon spelunceum TaxID=1672016 RepID=A0AAD3TWT7_9TREE|nr:hypothetical protein CspeluHIS016_0503950 [Cutaneotrichosporon spelunceum]
MSTTALAPSKAKVPSVGPIGLLADVALGYSPRKSENILPPISQLTGEVRALAPRRTPHRLSPAVWNDVEAQSQTPFLQLPPPVPDPSHRGHHPSHQSNVLHHNSNLASQPHAAHFWNERDEWYSPYPPDHRAPTHRDPQTSPHPVLPSAAYAPSGERHIPLPNPALGYPVRGSASVSNPASTASRSASASAGFEQSKSAYTTPCAWAEDQSDNSSGSEESDDEDEWTPPKRRPATPRTRSSARLAVKRERDYSELRDLEEEAGGSVSPVLDGKHKKRTYVRRDAQRRKEQNAQAQKKFRWKKKVLQEQMRSDLDEQRALVEELQQKCATFEGLQFALAEAQADNARLATRLEACVCKGGLVCASEHGQ